MAGPWEKYAAQAGPWTKYAASEAAPDSAMPSANPMGLANRELSKYGIQVGPPSGVPKVNMQAQGAVGRFTSAAGATIPSAMEVLKRGASGLNETADNDAATAEVFWNAVNSGLANNPNFPLQMNRLTGKIEKKGSSSTLDNAGAAIQSFTGINPVEIGNRIGSGDIAGGAGELTGNVAQVSPALVQANKMGSIQREEIDPLGELQKSAKDNLIAALKPTGKIAPKLDAAIDVATPDLQKISATDSPKTLPEIHGSLKKLSLGYEAQFNSLLKPSESVPVSTDPIADRIQSQIDKHPEMAGSLNPLIDKYRGNTMTLGELNLRRPDVSGIENTGIRDVLYGELERINPNADVAGLKKSQSAILTLQKAAQTRMNNLITPDAAVKAQPISQRAINAAVSMHVTRPATIPLALARLAKPKVPSDISNTQIGSAMKKLFPK